MFIYPAPAWFCPSIQPIAKGSHHPTTRPTDSGWGTHTMQPGKEEVSGEREERWHRAGSWTPPENGSHPPPPAAMPEPKSAPGGCSPVTPQHSQQSCLSPAVRRAQALKSTQHCSSCSAAAQPRLQQVCRHLLTLQPLQTPLPRLQIWTVPRTNWGVLGANIRWQWVW